MIMLMVNLTGARHILMPNRDRINFESNPSIEVVIDLHRDGVADTTHLVTEVDGRQMAKIMFLTE